MRVCDVFMAFLNAQLTEEVYMYAPVGIDIGTDDEGNPLVFRLLRAVYGIVDAPLRFSRKLRQVLRDAGFDEIPRMRAATLGSKDAKEGIASFIERRDPVFRGE